MWTAITRKPSPSLIRCALDFLDRNPIDFSLAMRQHDAYESCLRRLGIRVVSLPAEPELPDAVFVEDPLVALDEVAVLGRMSLPSRRPEPESVARAVAPFRPVVRIVAPGTLEGGDILRAGRTIYAGLSSRTNAEGIRQLEHLLAPFGYTVAPVPVPGCLHLKTACTHLGGNVLLANRAWFDATVFRDFEILDTPREEPWSANTLRIGDTVLLPASFPRAAETLNQRGFDAATLDISEFQKAEGGLTCLSLIFEA
jgi:dimethylargininase